MVLAGIFVLLGWLQVGPILVPTCRTMAMRALSPDTRVIATGTSRVERGVDPRLIGEPLVNISSGGLSYLTMKPMIQRAIQRAPGVRLVLIELDIFLLKGKGLIQERLFELDVPMRYWPMSRVDRAWFALENGWILSAMPRLDVEYMAQSIRPNERPPAGANGFNPYPFFRDLSDEGGDELYGAAKYISMHRKELVGDMDGRNIAALLALLAWLDEQGIQWRLVTLPHLPGWVDDPTSGNAVSKMLGKRFVPGIPTSMSVSGMPLRNWAWIAHISMTASTSIKKGWKCLIVPWISVWPDGLPHDLCLVS
jgi:hypothetical protein